MRMPVPAPAPRMDFPSRVRVEDNAQTRKLGIANELIVMTGCDPDGRACEVYLVNDPAHKRYTIERGWLRLE